MQYKTQLIMNALYRYLQSKRMFDISHTPMVNVLFICMVQFQMVQPYILKIYKHLKMTETHFYCVQFQNHCWLLVKNMTPNLVFLCQNQTMLKGKACANRIAPDQIAPVQDLSDRHLFFPLAFLWNFSHLLGSME